MHTFNAFYMRLGPVRGAAIGAWLVGVLALSSPAFAGFDHEWALDQSEIGRAHV